MKDVELFEKLLSEDENNDRYKYYLAQAYFHTRNYDKALDNYKKIIDMNKHNIETTNSLSMINECNKILINCYPEIEKNDQIDSVIDSNISLSITSFETTKNYIIEMSNSKICIEIFI